MGPWVLINAGWYKAGIANYIGGKYGGKPAVNFLDHGGTPLNWFLGQPA